MDLFFYAAIRFLTRLYTYDTSMFWTAVAALLIGGGSILTLILVVCKRKADQRKLAAWVQEKQTKGRKNFEADSSTSNNSYRSNCQSAHFLDLFSRQWTQEERESVALSPQAQSRNDANS
jgi:Tfp pilus assembly protein PilP